MAVVVKETHTGRRRTARDAERTYFIKGAADETAALAAMLADPECPTAIDTLPRNDSDCRAEELEAGHYLGTAYYRSPDTVIFQQPNSFSISFDISGQATRVTQSKQTMESKGWPGGGAEAIVAEPPRDFRGAMNVQQDGTVEGTDILVPFLTYTVTYTFPDAAITTAYVNTLALIVGTVNNAAFHGYAEGELLLARVSGQKRQDNSGNWDVTFGFAVSRNKSNFVINPGAPVGAQITIVEKKGWDFLWVYYGMRPVAYNVTGKALHKVPVSAYVERVYDFTNYWLLGI